MDEDGRPLRQPGPNPLMVGQERDGNWLRLNPHFEEVSIEYDAAMQTEHKFLELVADEELPEVQVARPVAEEEDGLSKRAEKQSVVKCHCLPAVSGGEDSLYEQSMVVYGQQITLEVLVLQDTDIVWRAWTNVGVRAESIIYVPSAKRWWHVVQSQPWKGGQLLDCIPSTRKPDFQGGAG